MSFIIIRENNNLMKISEFTVVVRLPDQDWYEIISVDWPVKQMTAISSRHKLLHNRWINPFRINGISHKV